MFFQNNCFNKALDHKIVHEIMHFSQEIKTAFQFS